MSEFLAEILLRALGLFYVFAGVTVIRVTAMSEVLDRALAGISREPPNRAEQHRQTWHAVGAVVTGLGGLGLFLLLDLAVWLMLASALQQALYLGWVAPRFFDPADPPDVRGRRQTRNAFLAYCGATVLAASALEAGLLRGTADQPDWLLAGAGVLSLGAVATVVRLLGRRSRG